MKKSELYIGKYTLLAPLTSKNSGFSRWGKAVRDGKVVYIKEYLSPVMPLDSVIKNEAIVQAKMAECRAFHSEKQHLYEVISGLAKNTGSIVRPYDFFCFGGRFYLVTEFVDAANIAFGQVCQLPFHQRMLLLRVLSNSIAALASEKIVHGDLKPENIILKKTGQNALTLKLIDFDCSFFSGYIPKDDGEDLHGDPAYMAPEAFLSLLGNEVPLTEKIDVFALGLIFHYLFSGSFPKFSADYDYAYETVLNDAPIELSPIIPSQLRALIATMLRKNPENRPSAKAVFEVLCKIDDETPAPPSPTAVSKNFTISGLKTD